MSPTEPAEHRMADEGMVGWIQLLGEQYCFAVIVCSSTCSGFPGLGPHREHRIPVSRYTTIFCLSRYNTDVDDDEDDDDDGDDNGRDDKDFERTRHSTNLAPPRRPWRVFFGDGVPSYR